jgi:hypothetical protein
MGAVPVELAWHFRRRLGIRRAIETGTFQGDGAQALGTVFRRVISIEVDEGLYQQARRRFRLRPGIKVLHGDSAELLPSLVRPNAPTFYWLDGHWTHDSEDGASPIDPPQNECPVLAELAAIGSGHPDDCVVIDDARFFEVSPPPPHDPTKWPSLIEVMETLNSAVPDRHVTVIADYIVAVPTKVKPYVDAVAWGWLTSEGWSPPSY